MDQKVLQAILDLGYQGPIKDHDSLHASLIDGPKNVEYTRLVNFLTNELRSLCNVDEEVNVIDTPEDSISFMMELSSFLKEIGCPHTTLSQGHISSRLETMEDKILLLDYLCGELMASRMIQQTLPDKKIELKLKESTQASNLRKMLITLRYPRPPANIAVDALFQKLNATVQNVVTKAADGLIGTPICNFTLSNKQWHTLEEVQKDLHLEYKIRREMMLKRLDCTIQSFQWSDKMKGKDELINRTYSEKRKQLKVEPDVNISDLLSARQDLAIIEKTSSASVRKNTQSSVNKIIIGQVPDRGGRTSEQAPPPPEMPSWQQRQPGPSGGGRGRGDGFRGGRGRGDNNRGGFGNRGGYDNSNKGGDYGRQTSQQGNYQQSQGSYQQEQGNYRQGQGNYQQGATQSQEYNRNSDSKGYSNYQRGGSGGGSRNYGSGNQQQNYDSAGSYSTSYGGNYEQSSKGSNQYGGNYEQSSRGSNQYGGNYEQSSRGSNQYGGNRRESQEYQTEPKRPKTYDNFQSSRTTYADQYVQESQNNQQRDNRNNRGGRGGRSNYQRGGGGQQSYY